MNDTFTPTIDDNTRAVIARAVEALGNLRGHMLIAEPGVQLLLAASLQRELDIVITLAVLDCRTHDYGWDEIAEHLGITTQQARARYDDTGIEQTSP